MLAMIGLAFAGGTPAKASTSASSAKLSGLARSAVARPQAATPVSPGNPGGDFTTTMDDGGVPQATMTQWISTGLPQSLGLSPNPTLSTLVTAVYNKYEVPGTGATAPGAFTGGSISATPTGVTVSVPAASVPTDNSPGPSGLKAAFLSGLISVVSAVVMGGSCIWLAGVRNAAGGAAAKEQQAACAGLGALAGAVSGYVTTDYWNGVPINGDEWGKAFTFAATIAVPIAVFLSPWCQEMITELGSKVAGYYAKSISPSWFGQGAAAVGNFFLSIFYKQPTTGNTMALGFTEAGLAAPVAAGNVGNVPTGTVVTAGSGDCMDAYLAGGTPSVGQIAAINACAVSADQSWTEWSNGMVTNGGLCLDDNGDTNSADTPLVNLQLCNGGYTQLWYEDRAGHMVDGATGNCLDDPGSNTAPGTQLRLYPCNNSTAQEWAPPGGTDAVTGFGPILSVLSSASSQYCMMPQTTLANPVGSNVLTESINPSSNDCNANNTVRSWAVGSNGTLMANGTNALCMDSNGPATTGPGGEAAYFVQLQGCDGSQTQVWKVVSTYLGPTLQNVGDGLCINTPSGQLGGTVSVVVASCASLPPPGELWTLPGFSAPTTLLAGGPCDIYLYYGTPCGAAYSMDRAMYAGYDGPLYQVKRASDGTTKNIGLLAAGGYVDASQQDSFCANTGCTVTEIYDQSPDGNNLTIAGPGGSTCSSAPGYSCSGQADHGADASLVKVTVDGSAKIEAYGLDITGGVGYADDATRGVAVGNQPEGTYMVASGTHVNGQCCMDFGNAETSRDDDGNGRMDAVRIGTGAGIPGTCWFTPCNGSGPWVGVDMENGTFLGANGSYLGNTPVPDDFVTAMAKNDGQSTYAIETGNAQAGGLTTQWSGTLPDLGGYMPMQKEGGIVLGTGGDNSNAGIGTWFEGVMTAGYPSSAADAAVQANIAAAGYAGDSAGPAGSTGASAGTAGQAVLHDGYTSVYTVNAKTGHLDETYLAAICAPNCAPGQGWATQDLSATAGTPPVLAGTQPVALYHDGYTSVYTVDASDGHLDETYLAAICAPGCAPGQGWATQDLTKYAGTPTTVTTPGAVYHDGYVSVYTADASDGHLDETYLAAICAPGCAPGQGWVTQDLTKHVGTPTVLASTSPVAVLHDGYVSVYTVDASGSQVGHLQETYLATLCAPGCAPGQGWATQDLTTTVGTPLTLVTPGADYHSGYTSVYTVDASSGDLQETYLAAICAPGCAPGQGWATQDLSATAHTPRVSLGTSPVALFHDGFNSVYTVDASDGHLDETYLAAICAPNCAPGQGWGTQDLSVHPGTPPTGQTPIALLHLDQSGGLNWVSVWTIDSSGNHLDETYLPALCAPGCAPGQGWATQDLSVHPGTPPAT
jgi:hypothetical protein